MLNLYSVTIATFEEPDASGFLKVTAAASAALIEMDTASFECQSSKARSSENGSLEAKSRPECQSIHVTAVASTIPDIHPSRRLLFCTIALVSGHLLLKHRQRIHATANSLLKPHPPLPQEQPLLPAIFPSQPRAASRIAAAKAGSKTGPLRSQNDYTSRKRPPLQKHPKPISKPLDHPPLSPNPPSTTRPHPSFPPQAKLMNYLHPPTRNLTQGHNTPAIATPYHRLHYRSCYFSATNKPCSTSSNSNSILSNKTRKSELGSRRSTTSYSRKNGA